MNLNDYRDLCHADARKWWYKKSGKLKKRNKGELIALMHSELSEALDAERKGLMDDKLPHRKGAEVEFADALMRIFDYAGAHGYDLEGALQEKREFNLHRKDHKKESSKKSKLEG